LYIRAENGQLPELQRVIASYGDQVVMGETLPATLNSLFTSREGAAPPVIAAVAPQASSPTGAPPPPAQAAMHGAGSESAAAHYNRALKALSGGNWTDFGSEMQQLGNDLGKNPATH
jgi:hypothetical protein